MAFCACNRAGEFMQIKPARVPAELLLGLTDSHLALVPELRTHIHNQVVQPLLALRSSARAAGFSLQVASSYRSFERQLFIWNAKVGGQRPVLDNDGQPINLKELSDIEKVHAILRWSALPGSSRHHWGTDLDIYESSSIAADYCVQLTQEECAGAGPFAAFHRWLGDAIATGNSFGFYRPYAADKGGVAPEPWHISYAPLAQVYARQRTEALLRQQLEACDIALKACILEHLPELFSRYVSVLEGVGSEE